MSTRTLAVILGVSACPEHDGMDTLPHCARSADAFRDYFISYFEVPSRDVLYLFDSDDSPSDQLSRLDDWLSIRLSHSHSNKIPFENLFLYYSGHGGFVRPSQEYFLATRKTRRGNEGATSIRFSDLSSTISKHHAKIRYYYILDCCYAANAIIRKQSDIETAVERKIDESAVLGSAFFCASSRTKEAIAPSGEKYTMFSGAVLSFLKEGSPKGPEYFTLVEVCKAAKTHVRRKFPLDAVLPQLHVPDQDEGDPSEVPLFPNMAFSEDSVVMAPIIADVAPNDLPANIEARNIGLVCAPDGGSNAPNRSEQSMLGDYAAPAFKTHQDFDAPPQESEEVDTWEPNHENPHDDNTVAKNPISAIFEFLFYAISAFLTLSILSSIVFAIALSIYRILF